MVTSVTSFSRTGLSDWLIQRVTSIILLAYFLLIAYQLMGSVDYTSWARLFEQTWMKVFTLMAALSLAAHSWIGLWSVFTDYLTERMLGPKGQRDSFGVSARRFTGASRVRNLGGGDHLELIQGH
jgi:succinate dehydrogenase / fumarate reductase membrane anchor subunit